MSTFCNAKDEFHFLVLELDLFVFETNVLQLGVGVDIRQIIDILMILHM
jgi:hypothetical protein